MPEMQRRSFLKGLGLAGTAAVVGVTQEAKASPIPPKGKKIGYVCRILHLAKDDKAFKLSITEEPLPELTAAPIYLDIEEDERGHTPVSRNLRNHVSYTKEQLLELEGPEFANCWIRVSADDWKRMTGRKFVVTDVLGAAIYIKT
jgi:hypothetical protein